jgi:hypothetical protein
MFNLRSINNVLRDHKQNICFHSDILVLLSRARVVVSRKSTLQNLLEASRSFITFLSLPFFKVVATDWLCYGWKPGSLPRARFPVTCCIGVALLVYLRSFGYIVSGSDQPVERSPGRVLPPAAAQGESGMDGVQIQFWFVILNYVSIILMFIPGVRPAGTLYCASFSGRG